MKMNDLDTFSAEVRAIQGLYPEAHQALANWGRWSMDRYMIGPKDARPSWTKNYRASPEEYGEDIPEEQRTQAERRAEGPEREPYDEKAATILSDRLEGPGGLSIEIRRAIRATYCTTLPENQLPREAGCLPDHFKERLSFALSFVGRFV